jgi:hypothetical protein
MVYSTWKPAETPKVTMTTTIAVRSDGSMVEIYGKVIAGVGYQSKVLRDWAARTEIRTNGPTQSKTTYGFTQDQMTRLASLHVKCTQVDKPERAVMLGVNVVRWKEEASRQEPDGSLNTRHVDAWQAPELGCFAIRELHTSLINGSPAAYSLREATALKPGEPDPRLFEIAADAVERSPSEVQVEYQRMFGKELTHASPEMLRRFDEAYARNRLRR